MIIVISHHFNSQKEERKSYNEQTQEEGFNKKKWNL
jgi:hypothetical protein